MVVDRRQRDSQGCVDRVGPLASSRQGALGCALFAAGLVLFSAVVPAEPVRAQAAESPAQESSSDASDASDVSDTEEVSVLRLGGWSPQLEFGFGVLTQSQDGQTTVPVNSGSRVLSDSGDSIITGFSSFGLGALSPVIFESTWKPRVLFRSSIQIPISDGLISDRADLSFDRSGNTPPGEFADNCPNPVPGSSVPTSTCSVEVRVRTTVNLLWTAGLGLDFLLPLEERIFHLQPAIEYIGMKAQPEGSYVRRAAGSISFPPPGQSARSVDFIKQVGASENFHGVAAALTGSVDAYRQGPWVCSMFVNGRAAWFLTDREIVTRRSDNAGNLIFVTKPAVNDVDAIQWQAMVGVTLRFDPLSQ